MEAYLFPVVGNWGLTTARAADEAFPLRVTLRVIGLLDAPKGCSLAALADDARTLIVPFQVWRCLPGKHFKARQSEFAIHVEVMRLLAVVRMESSGGSCNCCTVAPPRHPRPSSQGMAWIYPQFIFHCLSHYCHVAGRRDTNTSTSSSNEQFFIRARTIEGHSDSRLEALKL